jgi:hypothetical protein
MMDVIIVCNEEEALLIVSQNYIMTTQAFILQPRESSGYVTHIFDNTVGYGKIRALKFIPGSGRRIRAGNDRFPRPISGRQTTRSASLVGSGRAKKPTDAILNKISHPRLRRLYDYWKAKRGDRKMPSRADIDPFDITYVLGDIMLVDVIGDAPLRFRIRLHGTNLAERAGYELTGKVLDELPENEFRRLVRQRWTEVATTGEPLHCIRDAEFDRRPYRYESIILPLSPDGEKVNMELVALIHDEPRR